MIRATDFHIHDLARPTLELHPVALLFTIISLTCLPASSLACMPPHLPACLLTCLPVSSCLPASSPACLPPHLPACLLTCLPASSPACLSPHLLACLLTCLPVSASKARTVWSGLADTMLRPSGVQCSSSTTFLWPLRTRKLSQSPSTRHRTGGVTGAQANREPAAWQRAG